MKKAIVCLLLFAGILGIVLLVPREGTGAGEADYLRMHVRAHSNAQQDQAVKYHVRDALVAYLTPVVAESESKAEAMERVRAALPALEAVAAQALRRCGFSYGAHARLAREHFPTRVYEGVTLEAGEYDALILELGSARGDNWWCVVYPPLCFGADEVDIRYRSRIAELISRYFS